MLCKKVQFETSWLISIYFTYHQAYLFLQRSLANAARHHPELQQHVSSTHSLISSAGQHVRLDGEYLPGRIDVNDSVKKMELVPCILFVTATFSSYSSSVHPEVVNRTPYEGCYADPSLYEQLIDDNLLKKP